MCKKSYRAAPLVSVALAIALRLAVAAFGVLASASVWGLDWHVQTVDSAGNAGTYCSLALDSQDRPHISYHAGYDLKYAAWDPGTSQWDKEIVDDGNAAGGTYEVGRFTSIAIDSYDHPRIAYYADSYYDPGGGFHARHLKYAEWDGSSWRIETAAGGSNEGMWNSLALDRYDRPHMAFTSGVKLGYVEKIGSSWVRNRPTFGTPSNYASLCLDENDYPCISCGDRAEYHDLAFIRWDGSAWHLDVFAPGAVPGSPTSLALDSEGHPHIAFYARVAPSVNGLRYAVHDGSGWSIVQVDNANMGADCSLVLDANDLPHISYYDAVQGDLRYARYVGNRWIFETVDSAGSVGTFTSLVLDSQGNPHIGYYDASGRDLRYAYAVIPEPGTLLLVGTGILGALGFLRRHRMTRPGR